MNNIFEQSKNKLGILEPEERNKSLFKFNIFLGILIMLFFILTKDTTIRQNFINY